MSDLWEPAFQKNHAMWGEAPARSALWARDRFVEAGVRSVLVPGVGYGRNAKPFLESGMAVTGIEISQTAIEMARARLDIPIHHGSVTDMPFNQQIYDGIFCYGLLYLLDAEGRAKLLADCARQLRDGGRMVFTVISKDAPMYGRGARLGEDWYEILPGMKMYFYDEAAVRREFGAYGICEVVAVEEGAAGGGGFPFFCVSCKKG